MFRWCVFLNPKKARTSISPILFTANSFTQIYLRQSAGLPINHWHEMWTAPTSTVVRLYLNRVETWAVEEVTGRPPPVSLWPPSPPPPPFPLSIFRLKWVSQGVKSPKKVKKKRPKIGSHFKSKKTNPEFSWGELNEPSHKVPLHCLASKSSR